MNRLSVISLLQLCFSAAFTADLPTLYEYYTSEGINSGLSVEQPYFTLNGKNISIYSGAMHYFRIPRPYWRDRLRKLRASGLNTVETYVAWNLHEPFEGRFDFGNGDSDMQDFLDVKEYLKIAQEEDLLAIVRPGPYICAEWEFGGLPSWLLRNPGITVRTSDEVYMEHVRRYFNELLPILADLQFTKNGPVIAVQVENEYGYSPDNDLEYIRELVDIFRENGIVELLVSSDGASSGQYGSLPGVLFQTVNFGSNPEGEFNALESMQPSKPVMAMEFWSGWFDHWSEDHHTVSDETFRDLYERILKFPASVSMYMFHGGTNWGFLNGANIGEDDNAGFQPTTTSYDYDAPLSESGDYTSKYEIVKELISKYNSIETLTPDPPELVKRVRYAAVGVSSQIEFEDLVEQATPVVFSLNPLYMEELPINGNSGQSYGYVVYRKEGLDTPANAVLTIQGHIRDTLVVVLNGKIISTPLTSGRDLDNFGYWRIENPSITLTAKDLTNATLDLLVENWGRGNFGSIYHQFKGLGSDNAIFINDEQLTYWMHFPLEFKTNWTRGLRNWGDVQGLASSPALYRAILTIDDEPVDTYIDMEGWTKGVVIVNGFVLGKYALIGPQQTLYLPGPFLRKGDNEIVVFEQFKPAGEVKFSDEPIFSTV